MTDSSPVKGGGVAGGGDGGNVCGRDAPMGNATVSASKASWTFRNLCLPLWMA